MELSIFEVLGPVMIGPSSSHTAGVARLAKVAATIAGGALSQVRFGLSGSLQKTCKGHGTDKALLAGVLGLDADDERIREVESLPEAARLGVEYVSEKLEGAHENSVHFTFRLEDGTVSEVWGSSIGGGRIRIWRIGEFEVSIDAEKPTLVVQHLDHPGVISAISNALGAAYINIALMNMTRTGRAREASAVIETDSSVPRGIVEDIRQIPYVLEVIVVDVPKF